MKSNHTITINALLALTLITTAASMQAGGVGSKITYLTEGPYAGQQYHGTIEGTEYDITIDRFEDGFASWDYWVTYISDKELPHTILLRGGESSERFYVADRRGISFKKGKKPHAMSLSQMRTLIKSGNLKLK